MGIGHRIGPLVRTEPAPANGRRQNKSCGPNSPDHSILELFSRATEKMMRCHAKAIAQEVGLQAGVAVAPAAEFDHLADCLFRAAMYMNGYSLHRCEWRTQEGDSIVPTTSYQHFASTVPPHRASVSTAKKNPLRAIIEPMCKDPAIQQTLDQAAAGDPAALPAIRKLLAAPHFVSQLGNVANMARDRLIGAIAGDNLAVTEAVRRQAADLEAKLLSECTSPISFVEQMAVVRVVHSWLAVHYMEVTWASQKPKSEAADAVARQLKPVEKNYNASLKALATLRRLFRSTQSAQGNVIAGPMVVNTALAATNTVGELTGGMDASTPHAARTESSESVEVAS